MLELHYPTLTKTILKHQHSRKPTLKVALEMATSPFSKTLWSCALLSSSRRDGQDHQDKHTTKFTTTPTPPELFTLEKVLQLSADHHARWPPCKLWEHRFSVPDVVSPRPHPCSFESLKYTVQQKSDPTMHIFFFHSAPFDLWKYSCWAKYYVGVCGPIVLPRV